MDEDKRFIFYKNNTILFDFVVIRRGWQDICTKGK